MTVCYIGAIVVLPFICFLLPSIGSYYLHITCFLTKFLRLTPKFHLTGKATTTVDIKPFLMPRQD